MLLMMMGLLPVVSGDGGSVAVQHPLPIPLCPQLLQHPQPQYLQQLVVDAGLRPLVQLHLMLNSCQLHLLNPSPQQQRRHLQQQHKLL